MPSCCEVCCSPIVLPPCFLNGRTSRVSCCLRVYSHCRDHAACSSNESWNSQEGRTCEAQDSARGVYRPVQISCVERGGSALHRDLSTREEGGQSTVPIALSCQRSADVLVSRKTARTYFRPPLAITDSLNNPACFPTARPWIQCRALCDLGFPVCGAFMYHATAEAGVGEARHRVHHDVSCGGEKL
jgi:hypothetical protein